MEHSAKTARGSAIARPALRSSGLEKCRLTVFSHKTHKKIGESLEIVLIKLYIIAIFGMRFNLVFGLNKKKQNRKSATSVKGLLNN